MDPFIGQLMCVGFNFAPPGWAVCDGSLLSIPQNTALFSLLGTTYGGDGRNNFALPDLRGRSPIGQGQGPGLSPVQQGESSGQQQVTLSLNQIPAHAHALQAGAGQACTNNPATTDQPAGNIPAAVQINVNDPAGGGVTATALAYAAPGGNQTMAGGSGQTQPAGGSQPIGIMNPYLGMYWIIATQGIFPSRQ
jgi:microcystin-dependent protein